MGFACSTFSEAGESAVLFAGGRVEKSYLGRHSRTPLGTEGAFFGLWSAGFSAKGL